MMTEWFQLQSTAPPRVSVRYTIGGSFRIEEAVCADCGEHFMFDPYAAIIDVGTHGAEGGCLARKRKAELLEALGL